ncbi:MAG TPA: chloride channel protein [Streptosporangiaceae bacterium]|nr:chloride channel protein [Streptosporangiaceae bacterium]
MPASREEPGRSGSAGGSPVPADPTVMLRSRAYLGLLTVAAILGVPISAAAYGFLALVSYLQKEIFIHLPHGLGFTAAPAWWPLPMLVLGGVLASLAIRYLPGNGGASPAAGFAVHPPPTPVQLPGVILAALASLAFGAVIGPEMPLIALGGGLAVLATRAARRPVPDQGVKVLGSAGAFAAISTLLGSPLTGAFLLMEASGLGGPLMGLILVPGLLASGVGALIFVGLDSLTGLGAFSLAIPHLPHFSRPDVAEFAWAIVIGLAAALLGPAILWLSLFVQRFAVKRVLIVLPLAGLAVGVLTIIYTQVTGKPSADILFSGQNDIGPLVDHSATYSVGTLLLLLVCKTLGYGLSRGSFRGGPIFPALFIGAAGGVAMSHLPGLPLVPALGMAIGAMTAAVMKLPLTSVLLASLLMLSDAVTVMPLVIVAVVVAYVAVARIGPRLSARKAGNEHADAGAQADTGAPA